MRRRMPSAAKPSVMPSGSQSGGILRRKSVGEGSKADTAERKQTSMPSALRIGQPNDSFEQEAALVADQVTIGGTGGPEWSLAGMRIDQSPQGKCSCGGAGTCDTCKSKPRLQPKSVAAAPEAVAPPIVHEVLRTPGQPLDAATRDFFEPRFGWDLGSIRVHTGEVAAESAQAVNALAYTVGRDIVLGEGQGSAGGADRRLLAHELAHTFQQERGGEGALRRQPNPSPPPEEKLVDDFAAKFPAAAKLIKPNPAAMKLVKEAFDAGATFGGYGEDGPFPDEGRAYTSGHAVYVPKKRADPPVLAMSDFLFELNNAIRQPKFAALQAAAAKGAKSDTAAAKKYAHDTVEGEVEGMLRLGEVWFETKAKYLGKKAHDFDKYDKDFFLDEYKSYKDKKKTKEQIIDNVLSRKYETGTLAGKTVEENYMEQYKGLAQ